VVSSEWKEKSMATNEESANSKEQPLPKSLEQLLRHQIFIGGVMDIFRESHAWTEHHRVSVCNAHYCSHEGITVHPSPESTVCAYKGGAWIPSPHLLFEFRAFFEVGITVKGKDGEIFFHATSFSTAVDRKVHVVLYPRNRPPGPSTLHVVGWQRTGQPIYNGSFSPYIVT
jgi:hypothetical protein